MEFEKERGKKNIKTSKKLRAFVPSLERLLARSRRSRRRALFLVSLSLSLFFRSH